MIIDGHQRHAAAVALGIQEVPVIIFDSTDELEILAALISSNKARLKDNVLLALEAKELMEVESKLAKRRMATNRAGGGVKNVSEAGSARDKVGGQLGMSGPTAQKLVETGQAIETLQSQGRQDEAEGVKKALKKSASAGHKAAKETGAVPPKPRKPSAAPRKKGSTSKVVEGEDPASDTAIEAADTVLGFIRARKPSTLTPQRQRDWKKTLAPFIKWHGSLAA
jgi:ParB-like chromosome segregation protein Spo0J